MVGIRTTKMTCELQRFDRDMATLLVECERREHVTIKLVLSQIHDHRPMTEIEGDPDLPHSTCMRKPVAPPKK